MTRGPRLWVLCCLLGACGPSVRDEGLGRLSLEESPVLRDERYRMFSSRDREQKSFPITAPGNKDFNNFLASCAAGVEVISQYLDGAPGCRSGMKGFLLAATDEGPGYVTRFWGTVAEVVDPATYEDETLSFFVDGEQEPVYSAPLKDWLGDGPPPFASPLTRWSNGSLHSYQPISFARSLRVVLGGASPTRLYYYQLGVRHLATPTLAFSPERAKERFAPLAQLVSARPERPALSAPAPVGPAERSTLLSATGQGTITHLSLALPAAQFAALESTDLVLRFDGASTPQVELPLSLFFGLQHGLGPYRSLAMAVALEGETVHLDLRLPMPFAREASVEVHNRSPQPLDLSAGWKTTRSLPSLPWGHLHARAQSYGGPFADGQTFTVADVEGRGAYAGTFVFLEGGPDPQWVSNSPFAFLEGDELIEVDGELAVAGTGTEDYFNAGWYFVEGLRAGPWTGVNALETTGSGTGRVSAYRWHVPTDTIPFRQRLTFRLEYGANRPVTARAYTAVAYFYLLP